MKNLSVTDSTADIRMVSMWIWIYCSFERFGSCCHFVASVLVSRSSMSELWGRLFFFRVNARIVKEAVNLDSATAYRYLLPVSGLFSLDPWQSEPRKER